MKMKTFVATFLAAMTLNVSAAPGSYLPKNGTGKFLAKSFDLASIRSSINPRRSDRQRTFIDLGLKPSQVSDTVLVFNSAGDWRYEMKVLDRRDFNGDGIEDLAVCFTDRALNGGTYDTSRMLLVTRYSRDSYALAIDFKIEHPDCPEYAR